MQECISFILARRENSHVQVWFSGELNVKLKRIESIEDMHKFDYISGRRRRSIHLPSL